MQISVRGTNGSAKSTLVRSLIDDFKGVPIYGILGPRYPEAYECKIKGVKKPTYVLGPYHTPTGGCDQIQPYEVLLELIERYAKKGHIVFEGVIISSGHGRVGALMDKLNCEPVYAFMTTSLEDCIKNVKSRRAKRADAREFDPKNVIKKHQNVVRHKAKLLERKARVVNLQPARDSQQLVALLRSAK